MFISAKHDSLSVVKVVLEYPLTCFKVLFALACVAGGIVELRPRWTLAIIMYAFMHELRRLKPTANEIFMKFISNVLCISNYTLLFSALTALCPVRWNVANYHN